MITNIGIAAGNIWELLDREKSVELDSAVRDLPFERELVFMALGWLAREGHVLFRIKNGVTFIELNHRPHANVR